jgi:Flp pilus assembly protein TadD
MQTNKNSLRSTVRSVPFAVAATLVLTGCSSAPFARVGEYQRAQHDARMAAVAPRSAETPTPAPPTQLTRPDDRDYVASAAYWGAQVQANPDDLDANINFSRNLRMMGGATQAVTVMKAMVMRAPNSGPALAEYGKALTAAERPQDAIGFLTQAIQLSPSDWTLLSARGVAYDQANDHTAARADYLRALNIDPNNSTVQTNMALSYVLAGQPAQAEPILRRVVARADATAAMRQNLAMVLALQGKSAEATAIGRVDLAPEDAQNNANLFSQFETPRAAAAPIPAVKSQASAIADEPEASNSSSAPALIAGDPMATPMLSAATTPASQSPARIALPANQGPRPLQMQPVADDAPAPAPVLKPKPAKKPAPKITAATPAAPTNAALAPRPVISNGETLITTINGIPVIGDSKPVKGKPSAKSDTFLRGGSL